MHAQMLSGCAEHASLRAPRFQRGLPAALTTVNEECMRMQPSDAHVEQPLNDMVSAMLPVVDDEEFHHGGEDDEFGACCRMPSPARMARVWHIH